jgi:hypothetical protein
MCWKELQLSYIFWLLIFFKNLISPNLFTDFILDIFRQMVNLDKVFSSSKLN